MGRKKDAVAQWRRALQIEPTDAELRNLLGEYE
jgi:Flp pilus assembly protein TadD